MKSKALYWILLSVTLMGCRFGNHKPATGSLPVIDLSNNYQKKEIRIQDIADIEYIPLETTEDVLLDYNSFVSYISDNYIVVNSIPKGGVCIFNRKGELLSHFEHRGNGPKEYILSNNVLFDEKNMEIFVLDGMTQRFLIYTINGEYKRSFTYSKDLYGLIYVYDCENGKILVYSDFVPPENSDYVYRTRPYMLMSKQDGSIVDTIDILLNVRYSQFVHDEVDLGGGKKGTVSNRFSISQNNTYNGRDFVIADVSSDTIFRLTQNGELTPMLVRTPSVHSSEPPMVWSNMLVTDKFIVLYTTVFDKVALDKGRSIPYKILMYEFETGQTYQVDFINDDYKPGGGHPHLYEQVNNAKVPKNMYVDLVWPTRLKEYYEAKKSKGEIEKIPDAEDNPVVVIYQFK
jgi:hypothetical protein